VTTEVHQQQRPFDGDPHVADSAPRHPHALSSLLNLAPAELELNTAKFTQALEAAVIAEEDRASVAGTLLNLLESRSFGSSTHEGRSLRGVVVEAVLRLGYPWALQLDPDDLTASRAELRRLRPLVSWRRVGLAVAVIAALGSAAAGLLSNASNEEAQPIGPLATPVVLERPRSPEPTHPVADQAPEKALLPPLPANETAVRVATLRAEGLTDIALAVGEGCVIGYENPRPCVLEVARLAQDLAERSHDDFDRYRAKQWKRLVEEPSSARIREQGRSLFENEFARDASFLRPHAVDDAKEMMRFIEQASRSYAQGKGGSLDTLTIPCASWYGQFGTVCRDFRARVRRLDREPHASP
jgi:hypothetical protein